jgi:hypothetical protein
MAQVNTMRVYDQGLNLMGPKSGVEILESVIPISKDAIDFGVAWTDRPAKIYEDGRSFDVLNALFPTAEARDRMFSNSFDVIAQQTLSVYFEGSRYLAMQNTFELTNNGISVTLGTVQRR